LGTSWGSVLGVRMAIERPDLYYAYIGHSQVVNPLNDLIYDYYKVYKMAQSVKNKAELDTLNSIGLPPYDNPKNAGKLFSIIKKYERKNSIPAPESWSKPSSQYDNEKDTQHRFDGDDYSFVNYIGYKRFGVKPMASTINLLKDGLNFKIPVYLIQGEEDILTPKEITKDYFTKLRAPRKKFILLSKTAHGFSLLGVETQHKIMKEYLLPLINKK
jgi:pimeloyl-ACP methyl ester carboxylesterase